MESNRTRPLSWLAPVIVVIVALTAYWNCFRGPFIFDDLEAISRNPQIRQVWPLTFSMKTIPRTPLGARPVAQFSFALDYALAGLNVPVWKVTNLLVHLCCCLLLLGVVRRLMGNEWVALASALLFAVHPLNTELVNYVTQRTESLMAMFALLTAYCFIRRWYVVSVIACALGMGCKEVMVGVPVLILAMDRIFLSRSWREVKWPVHVALFATLGVMAYLQWGNPHSEIDERPVGLNSCTYLMTEMGVLVHYLKLTFFPSPLVVDYFDWPLAKSLGEVIAPAILVLGLFALTIVALIRWPRAGFVGLCFFVTLGPTSSFIPLTGEYASERRMYLPLAAIIPMVVVLGWRWLRRAPVWAAALVMVVVIVPMVYACNVRNQDYRNVVALWADTVAKRPANTRAWANLAASLLVSGDEQSALFAAKHAEELMPEFYVTHRILGDIYSQRKEFDSALRELHLAQSQKDDFSVRRSLALAYEMSGNSKAAMYWIDQALVDRPTDPLMLLDRKRIAGENAK